MSEKEEPISFEKMWDIAESDSFKGYAKSFYDEAKKANLGEDLIFAVVGMCRTSYSYDEFYNETFASKDEDLKPLKKQLAKHKHLPDGEAVLPL